MRFEWDEEKPSESKKAWRWLRDSGASVRRSELRFDKGSIDDEGEQRWHAVGLSDDLSLLVVHVYRSTDYDEEIIKIISARQAGERESRGHFGKPLSREQRAELAKLRKRPDS